MCIVDPQNTITRLLGCLCISLLRLATKKHQSWSKLSIIGGFFLEMVNNAESISIAWRHHAHRCSVVCIMCCMSTNKSFFCHFMCGLFAVMSRETQPVTGYTRLYHGKMAVVLQTTFLNSCSWFYCLLIHWKLCPITRVQWTISYHWVR